MGSAEASSGEVRIWFALLKVVRSLARRMARWMVGEAPSVSAKFFNVLPKVFQIRIFERVEFEFRAELRATAFVSQRLGGEWRALGETEEVPRILRQLKAIRLAGFVW